MMYIRPKRYEINSSLSQEDLLHKGFSMGGVYDCTNPAKVNHYCKINGNDIWLYIEISFDENGMSMFDDERDIHILHGDYMDTYFPFYYGDSERNLFGDYTLYKTITNYNKKMDALVSKGIFFPKGMSLDSSFRKR